MPENTTHLRFAPGILSRLGEELISSPYLGIMELVRNSYDADARRCKIELSETEEIGGTLKFSDDGVGMSEQTIKNGWLVLGSSSKKVDSRRMQTNTGRLPIGDKGLGRLAALRMGSKSIMRTRPISESNTEYSITFDWNCYDTAATVDEVNLKIEKAWTQKPHGTDIEVSDLRTKLTKRDVQQLARSLLLMADPFASETGFTPILDAPAYEGLAKLVEKSYFNEAEYRLIAELGEDGKATAKVFDWKNELLFEANPEDFRSNRKSEVVLYSAPSATFELWEYHLNNARFATRSAAATVGELREWLKVVGGVHLYQRGVRVHPYGDPGYDWLDMNLRRAQTAEESPSTNNTIGRVVVHDPDEMLISKTDRTGFIENESFLELKRFATDALDWMRKLRLRAAEDRRRGERAKSETTVTDAHTNLQKSVQSVPEEYRSAVETAVQSYDLAKQKEAQVLRAEVQLYRTLATVGTTIAVFAHEAGKPLTRLGKIFDQLGRIMKGFGGLSHNEDASELLINGKGAVHSLQSYSNLPIQLLQSNKRNTGKIEVHKVLHDVLLLLQPFLQSDNISVQLELVEGSQTIQGSIAALECVFVNLLTNAHDAVVFDRREIPERRIVIRTALLSGQLLIQFLDNGPGINGLSAEEIWLPGRTTKVRGLGLGLTIVKDAVTDLGGSINVIASGELGGAQFEMTLPIKEQ